MAEAVKAGIFVSAVLLIGAGIFSRFIGPELLTQASRRRLRLGLALGAGLLIGLSVLEAALVLTKALGAFDGELMLEYLLHTRHGQATLARTVLAVSLVAIGLGVAPPPFSGRLLHGLLALALLATISWVGHSGVMGWWPLFGDFGHLAAATLWAGAVAYLAWAPSWRPCQVGRQNKGLVRAVRRVSEVGLWSVAALMASGIYLSMLHMYGLAALTTPYGGALVLKIKLVSIIVVLAAVNRILLIPLLEREAKLRALAYGLRIESLVLVAVLVATGVLATSQPPHDHPAGLTGTAAHPHPVGFDDVPQGASAVVGANRLILPAGTLTVTPTDNGDIALQLRGESAATLELAAVDPNGEVHALATALASGDMLPYEDSLVRLPNGHTGLWTLRGRLNGTSFELAIKIEHLTTPSGVTLSLQLIPAPSLATGGATELFLVATSDDGPLTGPVFVQYRRPGMPQALAGAVVTPREPTSRYSPKLGSATLRFPSAGLYELTFIAAGEEAVLTLQVTD